MKRTCLTTALLAVLCSVGCCYRPGGINPYNGIAFGGRWEAMPGGPMDVTACYPPNYCPTMPTSDCYNVCEPPCGMPVAGPYMSHATSDCCDSGASSYPQTFVPSPRMMPQGSEAVPGGGMRPVPDPNIKPHSPNNGGATTYVVPQTLPGYPQSVHQATGQPWVHAH